MVEEKSKRFWVGIVITLLWIVTCFFLTKHKWEEASQLKLNEWGDVFAGFISPIAFLWFILSFLQQGDELKQNTKALELQAEELHQSVEHQREMVEVSRAQVAHELEIAREERERYRLASKPKFIFSGCSRMSSGTKKEYTLRYNNVGNVCASISLHINPAPPKYWPTKFLALTKGDLLEFKIAYDGIQSSEPLILSISYNDAAGIPDETKFQLISKSDGFESLPLVDLGNA